jgi:hypothetical protein
MLRPVQILPLIALLALLPGCAAVDTAAWMGRKNVDSALWVGGKAVEGSWWAAKQPFQGSDDDDEKAPRAAPAAAPPQSAAQPAPRQGSGQSPVLTAPVTPVQTAQMQSSGVSSVTAPNSTRQPQPALPPVFRAHLGDFADMATAEITLSRARRQIPLLFKHVGGTILRAAEGGRTVFKAQIGDFSDESGASLACSIIGHAGFPCRVVQGEI